MRVGQRVVVMQKWSMFDGKTGTVRATGVGLDHKPFALVDMDEGGEGLRFGFGELEELGPRPA